MKFAVRNTLSIALSMLILCLSIGFNVLCYGCSIHHTCDAHHCHDHDHTEVVKCNHKEHQSEINDCESKFLRLEFQSTESNDSEFEMFYIGYFETTPIIVQTPLTVQSNFIPKEIEVHRSGQNILKKICKMTC